MSFQAPEGTICYPWDSTPDGAESYGDLQWDTVNYTWDEVCVLISLVDRVNSSGDFDAYDAYDQLSRDDKKTFIKVLFKVRGKYESEKQFALREFKEKTIEPSDVQVTTEDVELVIEDFKKNMSVFLLHPPKIEK
jgi:hypothetical protein